MKTDILHVRQYRSKIINFIKFTNQVKRPFKTISTDSLFQKLSDLPVQYAQLSIGNALFYYCYYYYYYYYCFITNFQLPEWYGIVGFNVPIDTL